ncbi:catalytic domain of component of various dehydrogenase complexes [Russula earlei]|uniref:Catalytic domain of component of various dehydrogenase complexes n=1 Tax=Russula earlei TaxID=71964 RepID=A0ACC0TTM4_9AGAM|nr:catalytic domain of component of various dehydrogenase complexes [Russula earlei]
MAIVELVMPKMGESIMEATILRWLKQVGDAVQLDETLLEIATDKVDSEVPSVAAGIVKEILFKVDDVVPIGTVIARIETAGTDTATPAPPAAEPVTAPAPVETKPEPVPEPEPEPIISEEEEAAQDVPYVPQPQPVFPAKTGNNRFFSPLVLNIANSEGVSLSELEHVPGTGADGRVSKKDILQYIADKRAGRVPATQPQPAPTPAPQPVYTQPAPAPVQQPPVAPAPVAPAPVITTIPPPVIATAPAATPLQPYKDNAGRFSDPSQVVLSGSTEIQEMDRMRKLIAKHMVDSVHTSPHVTSFAEADVTNMVLWRERVKHDFERREGTRLTFTPMFVECIVNVIKRYPLINCSLDGDKIIIKKDINIGMATALPSGNLIVPVIKGADQLNIVGLSKSVNHLAFAARDNRLKPDDTNGGTFTLTNVGTFGSLMGTPIINQPQVAILAVGAIKKRPMVIETKDGDTIAIRHMMYLSLSYDHRIVDGSLGASFLSEVAKEFEQWNPERQWFHYI